MPNLVSLSFILLAEIFFKINLVKILRNIFKKVHWLKR
jgi:hypothetical protein